ncbi:MAG: hypothetical protein APF77_07315 [Clostridia bacterium BRH_c25]|nr:MAG: hypothetical protein APF77_07315 [Clostridia bacterium BRH_c25]
MMLKQTLEIFEILDRADVNGQKVKEIFENHGTESIEIIELIGVNGKTDFVRILIKGTNGRCSGGDAPTLGITGRLGGLGARPVKTGFVSDGDGALTALAVALKLVDMANAGDRLWGDVIVTTHICPDAPTIEHYPVMMMGSPVDTSTINQLEVESSVDAVLSVDTTKGNKIINHKGFAISCTVKEGYLLRVSDDLLEIMMRVTGRLPAVFALTQQDITPYGNGIYHLNSILQPATATDAPVVGVAITTETAVAGCATGATHIMDIETAARFVTEVAKDFTEGKCSFYDAEEYEKIVKLYGSMKHFQLSE